MIVRDVVAADRQDWERLFLAYGVFYETAFTPGIVDGVWSWLMEPSHQVKAVIAEDDGAVVGFAHYRRLADTFTAMPAYFLDDLYTDSTARGRGVASALIHGVRDRAGGAQVRWITAADNATAQRVYDRVATRATWVTYELG